MPTRFRKSFKIAPGVKVNVTKKGTSVTMGGRGAHVTVGKGGRTTVSKGIPGTGVYYTETVKKGKPKQEKKKRKDK